MAQNNYVQRTHRWVADDGNEAGSTLLGANGDDRSVDVDTKIRLRFVIEESADAKAETPAFGIYQNYNGGGFELMDASTTEAQVITSTYLTDGTATTERLGYTSGGPTFTAGFYCDDNDLAHTVAMKYVYTEVEFCITVDSALVNNNDTIQFRVYEDGTTPLDAYDDTPTLTVVKAAAITGTLSETLDNVTAAGSGDVDVEGTLSETLGNVTAAGAGKVRTVPLVAKTFTNSGGGAGPTTSSSIDTTGADFLLVAVSYYGAGTAPTLADSKSNTWQRLTLYDNIDSTNVVIFYSYNPTVGTGHTFTLTHPSTSYVSFFAYAFSGMDITSGVFDTENGSGTNGSSFATGSITPAAAGELIVSVYGQHDLESEPGVSSPFSLEDYDPYSSGVTPGGAVAFVNTYDSVTSIEATWTGGNGNAATIAAFKLYSAPSTEGTLSETLDNVTAAGTGEVDVTGQLSETLDNITGAGQGSVDVQGSLAQTLADVTGAGTGDVDVTGSLAETLDNITGSGQGQVDVTGQLSETVEDVTVTGTGVVGSVPITGTLSETLDNVTGAGQGSVDVTGQLSETVDNITGAGAGQVLVSGTLDETLDQITGSGAASVDVTGQAGITLADITLAGNGAVDVSGSLGETLDNVTVTGTGVVGEPPRIGTLSVTLDDTTAAGQGQVDIAGQAAVTLEDVTGAGTGTVLGKAYGSLDQTLEDITGAGQGQVDIAGSLSATLDNVIGSGQGSVDITGQAAVTLDDITVFGYIGSISVGTLNVTLDDITGSGAGSLRGYIQLEYEVELVTQIEQELAVVTQIEQELEITTVMAVNMEIGIDS